MKLCNINASFSSHKVTMALLDCVAYGHRNRKVKWRLNAKYLTAQQVFQVLYDWFTFLRLISSNFYRHNVGATGNGIIINDTPVQNIGFVCNAACMRFFPLDLSSMLKQWPITDPNFYKQIHILWYKPALTMLDMWTSIYKQHLLKKKNTATTRV